MGNLWSENTPRNFWRCQPELSAEVWTEAVSKALPILGFPDEVSDIDSALFYTLGEGQFGPDPWSLSRTKTIYYTLKPILPRRVINVLKNLNSRSVIDSFELGWPVERRYIQFQWETMRQILRITKESSLTFNNFWPDNKCFAFVLTHDIETSAGQDLVREIAGLEEDLGFRSLFNFVPERYKVDRNLMLELRERGFEIGVHGLKHDGKLFHSKQEFMKRAELINGYLKDFQAVGFRAPMMHRNPQWLQELNVDYDLSFFDTDPYEPIPGGVMSIWPFIIGHFIELPYTLFQDSTLVSVLGELTPQLWLDKVEYIEKFSGMALLNTHPDYLVQPTLKSIYKEFLVEMEQKANYWHALPLDVASWWRSRHNGDGVADRKQVDSGKVRLNESAIEIV